MALDLSYVEKVTHTDADDASLCDSSSDQLSLYGTARGRILAYLREHNALVSCEPPEPPHAEDFGLDAPVPYPWSVETDDPRVVAFWAAHDASLATEIAEPGIPAFKLESNDGWLVTPREIAATLDLLAAAPAPQDELITRFVAFLRGAVEHGGFTVD